MGATDTAAKQLQALGGDCMTRSTSKAYTLLSRKLFDVMPELSVGKG